MKRISAVFDSLNKAEEAISELRRLGVRDANLSVVARQGTGAREGGGGGVAATQRESQSSTGKGQGQGISTSHLFGLPMSPLPSVGSVVCTGPLLKELGMGAGTPSVGMGAGAIAGALTKAGYDRKEAEWFGREIEQGKVLIAVENNTPSIPEEKIQGALRGHGGRSQA